MPKKSINKITELGKELPYWKGYGSDINYFNVEEISIELDPPKYFMKLKDFDGFEFHPYKFHFSGIDPDDPDEEIIKNAISFASTKKDSPLSAIIEMLNYAEVSLRIDQIANFQHHTITTNINNINIKDVSLFIQAVNPKRIDIPVDQLEIIEDYKYLHYQNLKWVSEALVQNLEGMVIATSFDDLKDIIFDKLHINEDLKKNPLLTSTFLSRILEETKKESPSFPFALHDKYLSSAEEEIEKLKIEESKTIPSSLPDDEPFNVSAGISLATK